MPEVYLTVKEVAELRGCTESGVHKLIERGKLTVEEIDGFATGRGGIQYRIPLSALDPKHQRKYKRIQLKATAAAIEADPLPEPEPTDFECLSEHERLQITFWKGVLRDWNEYRCETREKGGSKGEADIEFVRITAEAWAAKPPIISNAVISTSILYSKQKALRTKGDAGLIDRRGKHGKHSRKLTREMQEIFEFYYLKQKRLSVKKCVSEMKAILEKRHGCVPELPSTDTFERYAKTALSIPLVNCLRKGLKTYVSKDEPYIRRMYDDLESNDIWVADGHEFDVFVRGRDGKPFKPHLTAFMDVRSRKMMGWAVTDRFCGDTTIYAMKKGVERYGLPRKIHVDNGREYLFYDLVGTAGFRKKAKPKPGDFRPMPILESLGVHVHVLLPANARGKAIERAFLTIIEQFSKLFPGYTGGSVINKPDDLKEVLKNPEKLITIGEFSEAVETYLTGYYNKQPHSGEGMYDRSPDEAYADELVEQRMVLESQLNLMFMRYSKRMMTVGGNGVTLKLYGETLQFSSPDLWPAYGGRKVYVRYAPDDLSTVRVYDSESRFICVARQLEMLSYTASKEKIRERNKANREQSNRVRKYDTTHGHDDLTDNSYLDAVIAEARRNLQTPETLNPQRMTIVAAIEEPEPGGRLEVGIDRDVLLKHAQEAEPSQNRTNRLRVEPSAMGAAARQHPEPEEPVNRMHDYYLRIALERRSAMVV